MKFAQEIKNLRQRLLLSQVAFAKEIDVSFSTVNRWEKGRTLPTYRTMNAIQKCCYEHGIDSGSCIEAWKEKK